MVSLILPEVGGGGCVGLAPGCSRHNLHMEELGTMQPPPRFSSSLPELEAVMPTAESAHLGDLGARKGSAERQTRRCGWHLRQPTSAFSLPFMFKNNS